MLGFFHHAGNLLPTHGQSKLLQSRLLTPIPPDLTAQALREGFRAQHQAGHQPVPGPLDGALTQRLLGLGPEGRAPLGLGSAAAQAVQWLAPQPGNPVAVPGVGAVGAPAKLAHRKRTRLTQEKLAEKSDLHPVYLGEIERGEQTVSVYALIRIARALGIRVRDLLADV